MLLAANVLNRNFEINNSYILIDYNHKITIITPPPGIVYLYYFL